MPTLARCHRVELGEVDAVRGEDFRGLHELARLADRRFRIGVILYLGRKVVPFGNNLYAVPMAALWEW